METGSGLPWLSSGSSGIRKQAQPWLSWGPLPIPFWGPAMASDPGCLPWSLSAPADPFLLQPAPGLLPEFSPRVFSLSGMWGRLIRQGPSSKNLIQPRHPQLLGVVGCCWADGDPPTRAADTTHLGPSVTPHHVTAPCDVIIGRHIMSVPPPSLKGLTSDRPREAESDRSHPGSRSASWVGLDWEEGVVSQDSPRVDGGYWVLAVPPYSHPPIQGGSGFSSSREDLSSVNRRALGVRL